MLCFIPFPISNGPAIVTDGLTILEIRGPAVRDYALGGPVSPIILGGIAGHSSTFRFGPSLLRVSIYFHSGNGVNVFKVKESGVISIGAWVE